MRVLHIGPLSSQHTQIAALTYRALGCDAVFFNTRRGFSPDAVPGVPECRDVVHPYGTGPQGSRRFPGQSLLGSVRHAIHLASRPDGRLTQALEQLSRRTTFDVIVGTWGVPVLEAMLAAQRVFPRSAFVHHILTFPDLPVLAPGARGAAWRAYMALFDRVQLLAYKTMLRDCDVRVHCSARMLSFMRDRVGLGAPGEDIIRFERFNKVYFPERRLAKLSAGHGEPHVVHVGATNFTGEITDNMSGPFARMARAGIHVHFHGKGVPPAFSEAEQRFLHPFAAFPAVPIGGGLAEFMTQCDAALMLFNVDRSYERFANALPTRFLYALVAGIPIAVPRGLFESCERYAEDHGIGFTYGSEQELAGVLRDTARMAGLAARARAHADRLSVEDDLPAIAALFERAFAIRAAR